MDEQLGEEMEHRKQTMAIKKDVMEKIQKYNQWVDEVREKAQQWRPKQPEFGRKVPFAKSDFYLMTSEKDYERYPELARMEREAEKQDEVEQHFGKYFKPK